jgi:hypothetical protein
MSDTHDSLLGSTQFMTERNDNVIVSANHVTPNKKYGRIKGLHYKGTNDSRQSGLLSRVVQRTKRCKLAIQYTSFHNQQENSWR